MKTHLLSAYLSWISQVSVKWNKIHHQAAVPARGGGGVLTPNFGRYIHSAKKESKHFFKFRFFIQNCNKIQ